MCVMVCVCVFRVCGFGLLVVPELIEKVNMGEERYFSLAHRVAEEVTTQPKLLKGGTLKNYQLKGLQVSEKYDTSTQDRDIYFRERSERENRERPESDV